MPKTQKKSPVKAPKTVIKAIKGEVIDTKPVRQIQPIEHKITALEDLKTKLPVITKATVVTRKKGRPTKYRPEYAKLLIEFFDVPTTERSIKRITTRNGTVIEQEAYIAAPMPFIVDYCKSVGIDSHVFERWIKKHEDFGLAYARIKELQERHLVKNALAGNYNPGFASLVAKNWFGWKDKTEIDNHNEGNINITWQK